MESNMEMHKGKVTFLFARKQSPTGWWIAGIASIDDAQEIRFVSDIDIPVNEEKIFYGEWETDRQYGRQFRIKLIADDVLKGLADYIEKIHVAAKIGRVRAGKMVRKWGIGLLDKLATREGREEIQQEIKCPLESLEALHLHFSQHKRSIESRLWLAGLGLTTRAIESIVEKFGCDAHEIVRRNPYILTELDGWGFKRADLVAHWIGVESDNPNRVRCAIKYAMAEEANNGNTVVRHSDLMRSVNSLLCINRLDSYKIINDQLELLVYDNQIFKINYDMLEEAYSLEYLYYSEQRVFTFLKDIAAEWNPHHSTLSMASWDFASKFDMLNENQARFINLALAKRVVCLSGGAGTGKTFSLKLLCEIYSKYKLTVALCAPTGKAARRMEESTGFIASTIHRLLQFNGVCFTSLGINADLLIVDEVSMMDSRLANELFSRVGPNTAIVLVGDHNQIPSVGPGAILRDIIDLDLCNTIILTETMRQAGELRENSAKVLQGEIVKRLSPPVLNRDNEFIDSWYTMLDYKETPELIKGIKTLVDRCLHFYGNDFIYKWQILSPQYKGDVGVNEINRIVQKQYQAWLGNPLDGPVEPRVTIYPYDKVIQLKNNYNIGVMNGQTGIVQSIDDNGKMLIAWDSGEDIEIEPHLVDDIDLAYALTIHKVQGSEFDTAVIVCHRSHQFVWHRNLLYTAVTRAKKNVLIMGDHAGVHAAANKVTQGSRLTLLPYFERKHRDECDSGNTRPCGIGKIERSEGNPVGLGIHSEDNAIF